VKRFSARTLIVAGTLALAASSTMLAVEVTTGHAEDAPGSGFGTVAIRAQAGGERVLPQQLLQNNDVQGTSPYADASIKLGYGQANSAIGWPGSLVANLGSVLILLSPVPLPQQTTALNWPVQVSAQSSSGPPTVTNTTIPGTAMSATATPSNVLADAVIDASSNAAVGSAGHSEGQAHVQETGAAAALAEAKSVVHNISMAGGQVTIGSVSSTAQGTTDGVHATATGRTVVSDMKIAGIPVTVDGGGVHASGGTVPLGSATQTVNDAIAKMGLTIAVSSPITTGRGGTITYNAGGLVLSWAQGVTISLGDASVQLAATPGQAGPATVDTTGGNPNTTGGASFPTGSALAAPTALAASAPALARSGSAPLSTPSAAAPRNLVTQPAGFRLPGGLSAAWLILALLGCAAMTVGISRLQDKLIDPATIAACPQGHQP
jgi:hypothetical protein